MKAIEALSANVQALTLSVDSAITVITAPRISESDVQAAADSVKAQSDRLQAALNPPALAPTAAQETSPAPAQ